MRFNLLFLFWLVALVAILFAGYLLFTRKRIVEYHVQGGTLGVYAAKVEWWRAGIFEWDFTLDIVALPDQGKWLRPREAYEAAIAEIPKTSRIISHHVLTQPLQLHRGELCLSDEAELLFSSEHD